MARKKNQVKKMASEKASKGEHTCIMKAHSFS